jgi:hypothetical protein
VTCEVHLQYEPAIDSVHDMVKRFMSACQAKSQSSSSSSSAAAAAVPSELLPPLESSFDNLDFLSAPAAADDGSCPQEQEGDVANEKGLGVEESGVDCRGDGEMDSRRVYFPEISLSDALEVTCDV